MNFLHVSGIWVLNFPTLFQFYSHERPVVCQLHCHCIKVVIVLLKNKLFMKFFIFLVSNFVNRDSLVKYYNIYYYYYKK